MKPNALRSLIAKIVVGGLGCPSRRGFEGLELGQGVVVDHLGITRPPRARRPGAARHDA